MILHSKMPKKRFITKCLLFTKCWLSNNSQPPTQKLQSFAERFYNTVKIKSVYMSTLSALFVITFLSVVAPKGAFLLYCRITALHFSARFWRAFSPRVSSPAGFSGRFLVGFFSCGLLHCWFCCRGFLCGLNCGWFLDGGLLLSAF